MLYRGVPQPPVGDGDEPDLLAVFRMLWAYKIRTALACGIGGLVALGVALNATPVYRAETVVTAARSGGASSGAALLAAQLGGAEGLSGVTLMPAGGADMAAEAVLESSHLVEEFIQRNDLLPELYRNAPKPPTLWFAVKRFKEGVLTIHKDVHRGVITIGMEWSDPRTAAGWANGFVALANEIIRTRALDESSRNIAYLNRQVAQTNVLELRQIMYEVIESETKTLMLANGRTEYAFEVVDPAVAPGIRIRPHRSFMVLTGVVFGLCIGVVIVLVLDRIARHRRGAAQGVLAHTN
jgi:uncharacterized protein involved in exopolysaccharide biosynthesis